MSTVDPLSPGNEILYFRLLERAGSTVWKSEDTRSGKTVAVKVLTRQLPKDPARRDALVRDVKLGAALYHAFLVPIVEVLVGGDALLLIMEWVDGVPISKLVEGGPLHRGRFFNIAYQIAEGLRFLHGKGVVHGNIGGESILLAGNDQVRIAGFNLANILRSTAGTYQQKGNDIRCVAYMSPEQISGQSVDTRTDIFSAGMVMYELATGRLPHQAATAAELAHKIVSEPPASPKAINASIDAAALSVIGRCVFKDVFSRYRDVKLLSDDIAKAEPDVVKNAARLARPSAMPATPGSAPRKALLLIGEVADYEKLKGHDPAAADRAASRLQQLLGEAAYLFNGQVIDPFGPRVIAEMPTVESALEAGRKGEFDFSHEQQEGEKLAARLLLHAGEVVTRSGAVGGPAIDRVDAALGQLPPLELFMTEDFAKAAKNAVRVRDAGALGGVKLFSIVPPEPEPPAEDTAEVEEITAEPLPPPPRRRPVFLIPLGAGVAVALLVAVMLVRQGVETAQPIEQSLPAAIAAAVGPTVISLPQFTVEGGDPALVARGNAVRLASLEILRVLPEVRLADVSDSAAIPLTATIRAGASGPEMLAGAGGAAVQLADAASGIQSILRLVSQKTKKAASATISSDALNAFAEAVEAKAANDPMRTEKALRTTVKADPLFLPAQLMAMAFFERAGKPKDALEAARHVARLQPGNEKAARNVARASLEEGDLRAAFRAYHSILEKQNDLEALNTVGRYAVAAGDRKRFDTVAARLAQHPPTAVMVHAPDFLAGSGQLDAAVNEYYDIEVKVPNNPALALKIGRIAVLRHTLPVAELELEKLQRFDPLYGYHLLSAFLAADKRSRPDAVRALEKARKAMHPADDYWTTTAEIHAMLADNSAVFDALQKAVQRREPSVFAVPSNSLFGYLRSDDRFAKVTSDIATARGEMQSALNEVARP